MNEEEKTGGGGDPNSAAVPGKSAEGFTEMQSILFKARQAISQVAEDVSTAKNNVSDYFTKYENRGNHRKQDATVLSDNYKLLGTCADSLANSVNLIDRVRFNHSEQNRKTEFMSHTIQGLKMEIAKLTEYQTEITQENLELGRKALTS